MVILRTVSTEKGVCGFLGRTRQWILAHHLQPSVTSTREGEDEEEKNNESRTGARARQALQALQASTNYSTTL